MFIRQKNRLRLEMAERVRVFFDAHPLADQSAAPILERLHALIDRAKLIVAQQDEGKARVKAGTEQRQDLRRYLTAGLFRMIARVGQAAARKRPELAGRFLTVSAGGSILVFIRSGEALVEAAREHADVMASLGVDAKLVDQAEELLTQYTALNTESNALFQSRVQAGAELDLLTRELAVLASQLDGFNRHRFEEQPESLAAWKAARELRYPKPKRSDGPESPVEAPSAETVRVADGSA